MDKSTKAARGRELMDILEFVKFTNLFRSVERVLWFSGVEGRERDGEHAFQLALVGWFINERCKLRLRVELIIKYALVHDLPEAHAGDACWSPTNGHSSQPMEGKEKRERDARKQIAREWGRRFPEMVGVMEAYYLQHDEESLFVYALDKLISDFNIFDDNGRTNHEVGVTRAMRDEYKGPRCLKHAKIAELYTAMSELFDKHPHFFHQVTEAVAAE